VGSPWRGATWALVAVLFYGALAAWSYGDAWRAGPRQHVPSVSGHAMTGLSRHDQRLVVWQVARNARVLRTDPAAFFHAELCYPQPRSLARGEPMFTLGLLAIPAELLGGDPVLAYNFVLFALPLIAGLAVFALVRAWTGSAPAALVAGLLYAFHPGRLADAVHPYMYDSSWTVLAMLFGQRLFERGRWRDALALSACACLQLGVSFYTAVAALLLAVPYGVWLVRHHGWERVHWSQLAVVVALTVAFAGWLFAPYLELHAAGIVRERAPAFSSWRAFSPGGRLFPGWLATALFAAAWVLPPRRTLPRLAGDPRPVLLVGALLVALAGTGPLWRALGSLLPGFDSVRVPEVVSHAALAPIAILSGIGAAGLLSLVQHRRREAALAAALVLVAVLESAFPAARHPSDAPRFPTFRIAPTAGELAFYAALESQGNRGPIFEAPLPRVEGRAFWPGTAGGILLAAYHRRPTSACLTSRLPDLRRLERIDAELPAAHALQALRELGFTTLVYRHDGRAGLMNRAEVLRADAAAPDGLLRFLGEDRFRVAFGFRRPCEPPAS
jgi:hypothetical protein